MAGTITTSTIQNDTSSPPTFRNNSVEIGTLCRAWVRFNGTGTVAINASFNVSSITDNGTGDYTMNFTTAMPDANYSHSGMCGTPTVTNGVLIVSTRTYTASACPLIALNLANQSLFDGNNIQVSVFR